MTKLHTVFLAFVLVGILGIAGIVLQNQYASPPLLTPTHPVTVAGATDYDVLIENLGAQVRVTEELNALQARKIRKLQQQIEILDDAGLRACDYLRRISTELTLVHQGLKAATLNELDLEKVQKALTTLRTNVTTASTDVNIIFLSSPVYHVPTGDLK